VLGRCLQLEPHPWLSALNYLKSRIETTTPASRAGLLPWMGCHWVGLMLGSGHLCPHCLPGAWHLLSWCRRMSALTLGLTREESKLGQELCTRLTGVWLGDTAHSPPTAFLLQSVRQKSLMSLVPSEQCLMVSQHHRVRDEWRILVFL
jgi:hypothetical protein